MDEKKCHTSNLWTLVRFVIFFFSEIVMNSRSDSKVVNVVGHTYHNYLTDSPPVINFHLPPPSSSFESFNSFISHPIAASPIIKYYFGPPSSSESSSSYYGHATVQSPILKFNLPPPGSSSESSGSSFTSSCTQVIAVLAVLFL